MALWAGSSQDTTAEAKLFNRLASRTSLPMVVSSNGLLYSFMGKPNDSDLMQMAAGNKQVRGWGKTSVVTGDKVEQALMGSLPSPDYVTDGADELTTATPDYDANRHGAVSFEIAHLAKNLGIPASEYDRIRGDDAKTRNWIGEKFNEAMYGYENKLGTDLHANSTTAYPARNKFASWITIVDDANTGYGLDRSDSANADFRSYVNSSTGNLDIPKIETALNTARARGGKPRVGVAGITLYGKIKQLVQAYSQASYSKDGGAAFGSESVYYAGVEWLLDARCPDGVVGIFDPQHWLFIMSDVPFNNGGVVHDFTKKDSYVIPTKLWAQILCLMPKTQSKLSGAN